MWDRRAPRPWIIAHRGASEEEPENTLRAFRRALASAPTWWSSTSTGAATDIWW